MLKRTCFLLIFIFIIGQLFALDLSQIFEGVGRTNDFSIIRRTLLNNGYTEHQSSNWYIFSKSSVSWSYNNVNLTYQQSWQYQIENNRITRTSFMIEVAPQGVTVDWVHFTSDTMIRLREIMNEYERILLSLNNIVVSNVVDNFPNAVSKTYSGLAPLGYYNCDSINIVLSPFSMGVHLLLSFEGTPVSVVVQNVPRTSFDLNNITGLNDYVIAVNILRGDIFRTFDGLEAYDTDLKKEMFLSSDEARPYIQRINELKNILRNQGITAVIPANDTRFSDYENVARYDTTRNGFWLTIGNTNDGYYRPSIMSYIYNRLPVVEARDNLAQITFYRVFIPVNRDVAVRMDGRRDLRVRLQMKISSIRDITINSGGWRFNLTYPVADTLKLIIFNSENVFVEHNF